MIVCYRVEQPARNVHAEAEAKWRPPSIELADQSHTRGLTVTGLAPAQLGYNWEHSGRPGNRDVTLQLSEAPATARETSPDPGGAEDGASPGHSPGRRSVRIKPSPAPRFKVYRDQGIDRVRGFHPGQLGGPASLQHRAHESVLERAVEWLESSNALTAPAASGRGVVATMNARHPAGRLPSGPAPEFTAMVEDPDTRRRRQQNVHKSEHKQEVAKAKWRAECLAVGRQRRLQHVADMRLLWVSSTGHHRSGAAVLIVVGAHYRPKIATTEDILLFTVKEFEKLAGRPYVVLYFNADAPMKPLPDTVWFQELHAALPAGHAEQLRALYVVHPKSHWAATRTWAFMLQGQESHFYGKMQMINDMEHLLATEFDAGIRGEVPQLVTDYRARHPGAA
mmetsp:Transcript_17711/g.53258  ORF Transcript_17711/g.53258 Transcript_17711/m.53258 type:complete len:394 (-) Transcript_17711:1515-2696(-)